MTGTTSRRTQEERRGEATHHFGSKGAPMQRLIDSVTAQFKEAIPVAGEPHSALAVALRTGPRDGLLSAG